MAEKIDANTDLEVSGNVMPISPTAAGEWQGPLTVIGAMLIESGQLDTYEAADRRARLAEKAAEYFVRSA